MNDKKIYQITKRCAIIFTVLFVLWNCLIVFFEMNDITDLLVAAIYWLGYLFFVLAGLLCWLICIGTYISVKSVEMKSSPDKFWYVWETARIGVMFVVGVMLIYSFLDFVLYYTGDWKIMDGLYHCLGIKLCVFVGLLACFIFSIKMRNLPEVRGSVSKKIAVTVSCVILTCVFINCFFWQKEYTEAERETVWIRKMTQYYDEHGIGPDVEPFSSR